MYYKVFIPSKESEGYDVTITVDADNWMSALSKGLERTGEGSDAVRNVMCDIKDDDTFHVTDASSERVFVLEEISEDEFEEARDDAAESEAPEVEPDLEQAPDEEVELELDVEDEAPPVEGASGDGSDIELDIEDEADSSEASDVESGVSGTSSAPSPRPEAREADDKPETTTADDMSVGSSTREELQQKSEDEAKVVDEKRRRTDEHSADDIGRDTGQNDSVSETLIEDFFLEIQPIHEGDKSMEEVVDFVMDLVMDKIRAESGSILFADTSGRELYFAAARGPKSDEVMDFRVPMGEGIVGFCSREGVSLAIGDAQEDPRFYREISEKIGYDTDSLLCAPIQHEGRVYGAIELVNKTSKSSFNSNEMNALSYVGRQLAEYVNRIVMSRESIDDDT
jgi:hypothetical protein